MSKIKMYKRGKNWTADLRQYGIGRVATGQQDKAKALQMAKRMLAGIEVHQTLGDAMKRAWHDYYRHTKGAYNVHSQMKQVTGRGWYATQLEDIDTPLLIKWRTEILEAGRSAKTANRYLSLLSKVMNLSTHWGWLEAVPVIPLLPEGWSGRIRVITDEELDDMHQLFMVRDPWMKGLTSFLLDTGCRLGESLRITPDARESALQSAKWTIWETKGGKPRTIPLTGRAHAALLEFHWAGKRNVDITRAWNWARGKLHLDKDPEFVPHALRHTRASQLVRDGHDLYKVANFLGHSSIKVTEKYAHLNTEALDSLIGEDRAMSGGGISLASPLDSTG